MPKHLWAHVALLAANLIYGANYTIAKEVMPDHVAPLGLVVLRCLGAVPLFWLVGLHFKERIQWPDVPRLLLCAVFGIAVNQLLFLKGLNLTLPINAAVIMTSTPILVLIWAAVLIRERITLLKATGIVLGLAGALLILLAGKEVSFSSDTFVGDLLILINASFYGVYLVIVKPLLSRYHPITVLKWVFLFGLFMVIPFGQEELRQVNWAAMPPRIVAATAFVVFGLSFFAYLFNSLALRQVSPSVVSIYIYLQPVLASMFAIMAGKDVLTAIKVVSAMLIFLGVYLVSQKKQPMKA
jgi:drug/metabolite transporter (DMT)-like permease